MGMKSFFQLALILILTVADSPPARTNQEEDIVKAAYCRVLERSADASGLENATAAIKNGYPVKMMLKDLVLSEEHTKKFVKNNSSKVIVTILFEHLLDRAPTPREIEAGMRQLDSDGVASLVESVLNGREFIEKFGDNKVPGDGRKSCFTTNRK